MKTQNFFRQILVFMTVTSNSPNFLPAKFSRYMVSAKLARNRQQHSIFAIHSVSAKQLFLLLLSAAVLWQRGSRLLPTLVRGWWPPNHLLTASRSTVHDNRRRRIKLFPYTKSQFYSLLMSAWANLEIRPKVWYITSDEWTNCKLKGREYGMTLDFLYSAAF